MFQVDEKKINVKFSGHKNFVYSLNWSQDDRYLLSVSSDQTARLWDVNEKIVQHIQVRFYFIYLILFYSKEKKTNC